MDRLFYFLATSRKMWRVARAHPSPGLGGGTVTVVLCRVFAGCSLDKSACLPEQRRGTGQGSMGWLSGAQSARLFTGRRARPPVVKRSSLVGPGATPHDPRHRPPVLARRRQRLVGPYNARFHIAAGRVHKVPALLSGQKGHSNGHWWREGGNWSELRPTHRHHVRSDLACATDTPLAAPHRPLAHPICTRAQGPTTSPPCLVRAMPSTTLAGRLVSATRHTSLLMCARSCDTVTASCASHGSGSRSRGEAGAGGSQVHVGDIDRSETAGKTRAAALCGCGGDGACVRRC